MKITVLSLLVFNCWILSIAQIEEYTLQTDIPYYSKTINQSDEYIAKRCVLDIYYPKNSEGFATIVWFHGGGLTGGNKEIPEELKGKGICVVGVNYRLYPNVKAPKYIEDAAAAVSLVFNNIMDYGGDSSLIFISGHSAGGYLASMIGLDKRWLDAHQIDANRIAGLIPLSGHTITHFTVREERGIPGTQPIIDDLAPLYHVRPDAPPLLLITGDRELEMLGRYEENAYLMRMMKAVGHKETRIYELDGYGHGMTGPAFPLLIQEVRRITERSRNLKNDTIPKVTGIGGIFFIAENPQETRAWYGNNLGLAIDDYGSAFEFRNANRPEERNYLRWSPFEEGTDYFTPSEKKFMINYRVQNIEGLIGKLRENGVNIVDEIEEFEYGKFVHILDPEGNKIELWEPVDSFFTSMGGETTK